MIMQKEKYVPGHGAALLVNPDYGEVTPDWFLPAFWGTRAVSVSSGGRGSAWFIDGLRGGMVLRHYLRGGYVAKVSRAAYLYTGEERTRSFAEFRLLTQLRDLKLPVPEPIAAHYRRFNGVFYEAAILLGRIENVTPLGDCVADLAEDDWFRLGQLLRRFHEAGVNHADLNCFNILLQGQAFYVIDFDKGRIEAAQSDEAPWRQRNLDRLYRSLVKLTRPEWDLGQCWQSLEKGYAVNAPA
ncbi:3-deoxy-D-manno-octulosonic acid kinase [Marinobacter halodurans]|nr:3-deoxy-D-manno-octulosonic acid kinase [Marinobacter halodurans]